MDRIELALERLTNSVSELAVRAGSSTRDQAPSIDNDRHGKESNDNGYPGSAEGAYDAMSIELGETTATKRFEPDSSQPPASDLAENQPDTFDEPGPSDAEFADDISIVSLTSPTPVRPTPQNAGTRPSPVGPHPIKTIAGPESVPTKPSAAEILM